MIIYLDQNKWVELARAKKAGASDRLAPLLPRIQSLVEQKKVSIPLSGANYMETWHRARWESRHELAGVMRDLSNYATIAPIQRVRRIECIELVKSFMRGHEEYAAMVSPARAERLSSRGVFGTGVNHAFDSPTGRLRLVESIASESLDEGPAVEPSNELLGIVRDLKEKHGAGYEWWSLAGPAGPIDMPDFEVGTQHRLGSDFAAAESDYAREIKEGPNKGLKMETAVLFQELTDAGRDLSLAAIELRFPTDDLLGAMAMYAGLDRVPELLRLLPSRYATYRLRLAKHKNPQWQWTQHDLADIVSLSVAATYCSIVVTERQWRHVLNSSGIATDFGTVILSRLSDLDELLPG